MVPSSTMRPSSSTIRRSRAAMVESRWAIAITVLPAMSVASAPGSPPRSPSRGPKSPRRGPGRRVLQDDAGDGDALALAAGELDAALADLGFVAAPALMVLEPG